MEAFLNLSHLLRFSYPSLRWRESCRSLHNTYTILRSARQDSAIPATASSKTSKSRSYPLTKDEAYNFLESNLGIPISQIPIGGKSLEFLNRIIKELDRRIPFTNINLLTEGPISQFKPEDWKRHMFSGEGGTCRWINPFAKVLLDHLGYTVIHIPGKSTLRDGEKQTHISTLVCDVSYPGSLHLVDSGMRWPLGEAIPVNFDTESPEYSSYQVRNKFFKTDNNILHLGSLSPSDGSAKHVLKDSRGTKWQIRMIYWLNKRSDWMDFNYLYIQTNEKRNLPLPKPFNTFVFYGFLEEKRISIVCPDGQINATFFNMEDQTTEKVKMTKSELLEFFQKHYPQYSVKKLEKACQISKLN